MKLTIVSWLDSSGKVCQNRYYSDSDIRALLVVLLVDLLGEFAGRRAVAQILRERKVRDEYSYNVANNVHVCHIVE